MQKLNFNRKESFLFENDGALLRVLKKERKDLLQLGEESEQWELLTQQVRSQELESRQAKTWC